MTNLQQPKNVIKIVLIIGLIAFLGFFVYKYLQFRTAFLEKQRVELAQEEKKKEFEEGRKVVHEMLYRCDNIESVTEITYKDNLLSVNLDCANVEKVLDEISKKIGVKIIYIKLGTTLFNSPISFNNLSVKEGLNIIGKKVAFGDDIYNARYLSDRNVWSFEQILLKVKNPPKDGVVMVVWAKGSYDFIRADGTVKKRPSERLSGIDKSNNNEYLVALLTGDSKKNRDFIVLNNQGEEQWRTKAPKDYLFTYAVSDNGKYIVANGQYMPSCDDECDYASYIASKDGVSKMTKTISAFGIKFSQNSNFFVIYNGRDDDRVFDENGNEVTDQKIASEIRKEVKNQ